MNIVWIYVSVIYSVWSIWFIVSLSCDYIATAIALLVEFGNCNKRVSSCIVVCILCYVTDYPTMLSLFKIYVSEISVVRTTIILADCICWLCCRIGIRCCCLWPVISHEFTLIMRYLNRWWCASSINCYSVSVYTATNKTTIVRCKCIAVISKCVRWTVIVAYAECFVGSWTINLVCSIWSHGNNLGVDCKSGRNVKVVCSVNIFEETELAVCRVDIVTIGIHKVTNEVICIVRIWWRRGRSWWLLKVCSYCTCSRSCKSCCCAG